MDLQSKHLKWLGMIIFGGCIAEGVYLGWKWFCSRRRQTEHLCETLFFPDSKVACKDQFIKSRGCSNRRCNFSHEPQLAYAKLLRYLVSTRQNLDLCVFVITCRDLADAIIDLHSKGVVVRIITDNEQVEALGSQISRFQAEGIQVRHDWTSYLMHHKFAVIDQWLLINGSFNWTRQAITGNNENVLITDNPGLVTPYKEEFEKLWDMFDPKKRPLSFESR